MWGNDFIFMDGFETPSGLWTINPNPTDYIATPWGQGFDGTKALYRRFFFNDWNSTYWFGASVNPQVLSQGLNSLIRFQSDYAYTYTSSLPPARVYFDVGLSPTGDLRIEYRSAQFVFTIFEANLGPEHFEVGNWNHLMVGVTQGLIIPGNGNRYIQFEYHIYKNNREILEGTSSIMLTYNNWFGITTMGMWDAIYVNNNYPSARIRYDNVWVSHNGPKGDLIALN